MNRNQIIGGIMGVVVGDALGLPVQFEGRLRRKLRPVTGMEGWGAFNMPPGSWSDDSSLTLCLVESICEAGFDTEDAGKRFLRWYRDGHLTPSGFAYDIGRSTARAMDNISRGMPAEGAGPASEDDNGNGSLMRIIPAAIYLAPRSLPEIIQGIWAMSGITHGHPRARTGCCIYALLARELLNGAGPAAAYKNLCYNPVWLEGQGLELDHYAPLLAGDMHHLPEQEIRSSGYVVDTLEAATWCLLKNRTFKDTVLAAVNLGEDTDTVAAVAGGLAGIAYGLEGIPGDWIEVLAQKDRVLALAQRFAGLFDKADPRDSVE